MHLVHVLRNECFACSCEFLRIFLIPKFSLFAFVYPSLAKQGHNTRSRQIFACVHFLGEVFTKGGMHGPAQGHIPRGSVRDLQAIFKPPADLAVQLVSGLIVSGPIKGRGDRNWGGCFRRNRQDGNNSGSPRPGSMWNRKPLRRKHKRVGVGKSGRPKANLGAVVLGTWAFCH